MNDDTSGTRAFFAKKKVKMLLSHTTHEYSEENEYFIEVRKMYSYKRKHSRAERGSVCSLSFC